MSYSFDLFCVIKGYFDKYGCNFDNVRKIEIKIF